MGAGLGESHPSQGGQPFLWEPSFRRAVGPGAVLVTGQGLAKKCSYRGPLLGGKRACPPAAWAEPGDSLGTWAGVTGISVWRGVRADRGGLGLGLSSVLLPSPPLPTPPHLPWSHLQEGGPDILTRVWHLQSKLVPRCTVGLPFIRLFLWGLEHKEAVDSSS